MAGRFSVAMTSRLDQELRHHLLAHFKVGKQQEDLCFALWAPSNGIDRRSALISESVFPAEGDRELHGNASFTSQYFSRVMALAVERGLGIAFLHSHPTKGWQGMSPDDIVAEDRLAPRVQASTGLPLVGLTVGTDGSWSARFWHRRDKGQYQGTWCRDVRIVGDALLATFHDAIAPKPDYRDVLKRTFAAWGEDAQGRLARTRVGIIGLGSIGGLVAEALARMGVEHLVFIDFDRVKKHNLDRLVYATEADIGQLKVEVAARFVREHATAAKFEVVPISETITEKAAFKAALDCDVLFSCVDRPWPRQVMNLIAYAHLIPVIDGGVCVRVSKTGKLRGAEWRAHVAAPGRPCLECLGQFDPAHVSLEKQGLLDDPSYISGLPTDHFINRNENVFAFAMNAAGLQVLQFLSLLVAPGGVSDVGPQTYHLSTGTLDRNEEAACLDTCLYAPLTAAGELTELNHAVLVKMQGIPTN